MTIDRVQVSLVAQTRQYNRGVRRADRATTGLTRSIGLLQNVGSALRFGAGGLLGSALGGAALASATAQQIAAIDNLAKTAAKLGIGTKELAGLRLAARRTGLETRQLDLGLQRMVRVISEAAAGTGEAQAALKELGLDAKKLNTLGPAEQFKSLAQAMQGVARQSDRIRIGFRFFDTRNVALINTLAAGREGLDNFTREAQRLGLAVSGEQARRVEELSDSLGRLRDTFAGAVRGFVVANAVDLTGLVNSIQGLVVASTPLVGALGAVVTGLSNVAATASRATGFVRELAAAMRELAGANDRRDLYALAEEDIRRERPDLLPAEARDAAIRRVEGFDTADRPPTSREIDRARETRDRRRRGLERGTPSPIDLLPGPVPPRPAAQTEAGAAGRADVVAQDLLSRLIDKMDELIQVSRQSGGAVLS